MTVASISLTLFGLLITSCLMSRVARASFKNKQAEGSFRYLHGRNRIYSECIAFYNGEDKERAEVVSSFDRVYTSVRQLLRARVPLLFWLVTFFLLSMLAGYIFLAISILWIKDLPGETNGNDCPSFFRLLSFLIPIDFSFFPDDRVYQVKQAINASSNLVGYLNGLPTLLARLAFIASVTHRVAQLFEVLKDIGQDKRKNMARGVIKDGTKLSAVDFLSFNASALAFFLLLFVVAHCFFLFPLFPARLRLLH
jgi:ABC-type uncharacterized transport system fused permease/ATPase subunit